MPFPLASTVRPLALGLLLAAASTGAAQPPVAKPIDKALSAPVAPTPIEPADIRSFTIATDAELADMTQLFAGLYTRLAPKPATPATPAAKTPKFTAIARTKTVIVRGTKAELDRADAVVKLIRGEGAADGKGPQVMKLKVCRVDEVVAALASLEFEGRVVPLRATNSVIILPGNEADIPQIKKVIDALEAVPAKTPAPPK